MGRTGSPHRAPAAAYDRLVGQLDGVLTQAWRLYRARAARLILAAAAVFVPARGIDAAIYGSAGLYGLSRGLRADLVDTFAALVLLVIVARLTLTARAGEPGTPGGRAPVSLLRPVIAAALLAAVITGDYHLADGSRFGPLIAVPLLYLGLMGMVTLPVAVAERSGLIVSLLRSWRLIRHHEWSVAATFILAWLANLAMMLPPVIVASLPAVPFPQSRTLIWATQDIFLAPFLALTVTVIYQRLTRGEVTARPAAPGPVTPGGAPARYGSLWPFTDA